MTNIAQKWTENGKLVVASLALYALVLLPILSARFYYLDDSRRAVIGDLDWGINGRPLTDMLMSVLSFGTPIPDAFPLYQILAVVVLTTCSLLLATRFKISGGLSAAGIGLALGANPLFLQNLSFRFDALSMSVATAFAVIPCALPAERSRLATCFGALSLVLCLCFYQPSFNVFLVIAVTEIGLATAGLLPERPLKLMGIRFGQFLLALCVYVFIAKSTLRGSYADSHRLISLGESWMHLPSQITNLAQEGLFSVLTSRFRLGFLLPMVLGLGAIVVTAVWRLTRTQSGLRRVAGVLAAIVLLPVVWVVASFALLIPILPSADAPRMFVGFGAMLYCALVALLLVSQASFARFVFRAILALTIYTQLFVAMVYGDALAAQKNYEQSILGALYGDLVKLAPATHADRLILEGNVGYSPLVSNIGNHRFKLVFKLVPIQLVSDLAGTFTNSQLQGLGLGFEPVVSPEIRADIQSRAQKLQPTIVSSFYSIYSIDRVLFVQFTFPH